MFKILSYPPTLEQIKMLELVGLRGDISLSVLRMLTVCIVALALWYWMKMVSKHFGLGVSKLVAGVLVISPTTWIICLSYPLLAVKLLGITLALWFSKKYKLLCLGIIILCLIGYNILLQGYKPAIFNKLSFKDAQTEVNDRITAEDSLKTRIMVPLWWRRVAYNKFFFAYKQVVGEILPSLDLESLFFQEVHPMSQKSVVMFYWPEIFLLLLGIYKLGRGKNLNLVLITFGVGVVNFVFSEGSSHVRLFLMMLPLGIIVASGLKQIENYRFVSSTFMIILVYSTGLGWYDLNVRTDYWLDNRPLAYQFWYKNIEKQDINKFNEVHVSTIIGDSKQYCMYYLGDVCKQGKFIFDGFDLSSKSKIESGMYAGFAGEFIGPRFKNDTPSEWKEIAASMGLRLVGSVGLRDTIAYKYGNDIGLLIKD